MQKEKKSHTRDEARSSQSKLNYKHHKHERKKQFYNLSFSVVLACPNLDK